VLGGMKRKAMIKLIVCYLIAAITMLLLLNTYGRKRMEDKFMERTKDELYSKAEMIVNEYATAYYSSNMTYQEMLKQISTLGDFLHNRILVINLDGEIIADSKDSANGINILDRDPTFLDNIFAEEVYYKGIFTEPMLSVVVGIPYYYTIRGYICLSTTMQSINDESVYYLDTINIGYFSFLVILSLIFVVIYFFAIHPVNKLKKIALEYAQGHFEEELKLRSQDEYKELYNTIRFMADELKNLDDYQKKFVANISHDFRSPLTSIRGYAEAIVDGTIPYDMQNKYLNIILFETERLTKLTTNLLALNSFDQKGAMLDIRSFDINEVIRKIAETFEGYCKSKRIVLKLEFSAKEIYVDADKDKIQQVLYNLLDNAIKFSNADSQIKVMTEEKSSKVYVAIKDYGIGIPKDSIKKIWERFYKTDTSRGKDKKGTGLGLSITKEIITAHKENINVVSTEGVGTEFIFTLPRSD
jgi:signal transduction histidine kinase